MLKLNEKYNISNSTHLILNALPANDSADQILARARLRKNHREASKRPLSKEARLQPEGLLELKLKPLEANDTPCRQSRGD